jgi:SAM-dependent methyltransferase
MARIHHSAAEGFGAAAVTYAEGRPEYPPEIEDWLRNDLGLDEGKTALDLGAGTGKFTVSLLATGATVIAVDPIPAMLHQLTRQHPEIEAKQDQPSTYRLLTRRWMRWFARNRFTGSLRRKRFMRSIVFSSRAVLLG